MTLHQLTREYLKAREELILSHARAGRNMTQAAEELGVSRATLSILIHRNGIPWHQVVKAERVDP